MVHEPDIRSIYEKGLYSCSYYSVYHLIRIKSSNEGFEDFFAFYSVVNEEKL